jgi:Rps23 Pro-64 3,4-dihydroxylase Tpa1-like proline 4-hydroxylase
MDSVEIAPGICVYSNVMSNPESLILDVESHVESGVLKWSQAYVVSDRPGEVDKDTRDTLSIGVHYNPERKIDNSSPKQNAMSALGKIFFEAFDKIEKDYQLLYRFQVEDHDPYSILKYGIGQKFVNHVDDHKDYHRRVSLVYYLNDNYVGGEINFPRFDISYKPKANELLIFPSTYVYNHSVSEVTSGTRYSIVSWMK